MTTKDEPVAVYAMRGTAWCVRKVGELYAVSAALPGCPGGEVETPQELYTKERFAEIRNYVKDTLEYPEALKDG